MLDVVAHRPPTPADVATLRALAAAVTSQDGHPPFGDGVWRDLAAPTAESTLLVATVDGEPVGALHLAPPDNVTGGRELIASMAVDPAHRDGSVESTLVDAAVRTVVDAGGGHIVLWIFGAQETPAAYAVDAGFVLERELHQLRVKLPLAEAPRWPDGIDVGAFRPGIDDDQWLDVNNRAFAADPDQSGWTRETLARRLAEPWFDPEGFLVARDARGMAGFCWTKVHDAHPPEEPDALGEIYVIGVDPDRQGTGLGRALVVGGLDWLHRHGITIGMLFVDAANTPALNLYHDLGFELARRDRAYARDVS